MALARILAYMSTPAAFYLMMSVNSLLCLCDRVGSASRSQALRTWKPPRRGESIVAGCSLLSAYAAGGQELPSCEMHQLGFGGCAPPSPMARACAAAAPALEASPLELKRMLSDAQYPALIPSSALKRLVRCFDASAGHRRSKSSMRQQSLPKCLGPGLGGVAFGCRGRAGGAARKYPSVAICLTAGVRRPTNALTPNFFCARICAHKNYLV
jgi:hypothetical protein